MSISDNLLTSLVIQYPIWGFAGVVHRLNNNLNSYENSFNK